MKKSQTVIVEDEDLPREHLKSMLNTFYGEEFEIIGEAKSAKEALELFKRFENIDVAFLDINLEIERAGLSLALKLTERTNPPRIVFTTDYAEYAVQAIKVHPVDYLLKPFSVNDLDMTVKFLRNAPFLNQHLEKESKKLEEIIKIVHKVMNSHNKEEKHTECVNPSDIVCVIKDQQTRYVKITLSNGTELKVTGTLIEWKKKLNYDCFLQIHKSYMLNSQYVKAIVPHQFQKNTYQVMFTCFPEKRLTIGEVFQKQLEEKLKWRGKGL